MFRAKCRWIKNIGGITGRTRWLVVLLLFLHVFIAGKQYLDNYDPLYTSIEKDPCYQDGVFTIYQPGDYARFVGYLNRNHKRDPNNPKATAIDAVLMADIDLSDAKYGPVKELSFLKKSFIKYQSFEGHPYIRQAILSYSGTFDGNGHTITWFKDGKNGMFVTLERDATIRNLTLHATQLTWDLDEYGVGMFCILNYGTIENCQTKGSLTGTECYTGGFAGINRGTIKDCENYANVSLNKTGDYGAGGIAGLNKCKVLEGESEENPIVPVIEGCTNYGTIYAPWKAGGICARNDCANIYTCGNEGSVTVQYQKGYIYPDEPTWYEPAMAAGICGDMGWNNIEKCYNTGQISIEEDGEEATYAIAGNTLFWINTVANCVTLADTATGHMRHESVMELTEEELTFWKEHQEEVPYLPNNWKFNLEEAKEKLPIVPLNLIESSLTQDQKDLWLCDEFYLQAPKGYQIEEVSPYAICIEPSTFLPAEENCQIWLMRLEDNLTKLPSYPDKEAIHEAWLDIPGAHWLHPAHSYADDCHLDYTDYTHPTIQNFTTGYTLIHYRDDFLAYAAVQEEGGMIDNIAALPLKSTPEGGYTTPWLLLFTSDENNYRPSLSFAKEALENFIPLPAQIVVAPGDTLWSLTKTYTGTPARYPEIATIYPGDPNQLTVGQSLTIPLEWLIPSNL